MRVHRSLALTVATSSRVHDLRSGAGVLASVAFFFLLLASKSLLRVKDEMSREKAWEGRSREEAKTFRSDVNRPDSLRGLDSLDFQRLRME